MEGRRREPGSSSSRLVTELILTEGTWCLEQVRWSHEAVRVVVREGCVSPWWLMPSKHQISWPGARKSIGGQECLVYYNWYRHIIKQDCYILTLSSPAKITSKFLTTSWNRTDTSLPNTDTGRSYHLWYVIKKTFLDPWEIGVWAAQLELLLFHLKCLPKFNFILHRSWSGWHIICIRAGLLVVYHWLEISQSHQQRLPSV